MSEHNELARAVLDTMRSYKPPLGAETDPANVVDALDGVAASLFGVATAIRADAGIGHDETGGAVHSLTESVMGITAGLCRISDSINALAEAVLTHGETVSGIGGR